MFEAIGITVIIIIAGLAIRWWGYSHYYNSGRETRKQFSPREFQAVKRSQERVLWSSNSRSLDRAFARGFCLKPKDFKEVFRWKH